MRKPSRRHNAKALVVPSPPAFPAAADAAVVVSSRYHTTHNNHRRQLLKSPSSLWLVPWLVLCLAIAFIGSVWRSTHIPLSNHQPTQHNAPSLLIPDVKFEKDPLLADIHPASLTEGCHYEKDELLNSNNTNESFGYPLVFAWRSFPPSMQSAYRELVTRISPCFGSTSGFITRNNDCINPEAHIYPFNDLHITVATFRTKNDPVSTSREYVEAIKKLYVNVIQQATKRNEWPKEGSRFHIRPKGIRLSGKNAIILWEEITGNLDAMRFCLKEEMQVAFEKISSSDRLFKDVLESSISVIDVPPIVHSTFLRFWTTPLSNPEALLQTFNEKLSIDILPTEMDVATNNIKLMEDTFLIHINNEDHIIWKAE